MGREPKWSLEALVAETRVTVERLSDDIGELRHDFRRLDDRLFQMLLIQVATLAATVGSLVAAFVS